MFDALDNDIPVAFDVARNQGDEETLFCLMSFRALQCRAPGNVTE
jgi:hypothetical protein